MNSTPINEWLTLWHSLLNDLSIPAFKEPDDMAGVLADLRRDPECLSKAFRPLPQGEELLNRVKRCIDAESQHNGLYLVPDPIKATDNELKALVIDAIERGSECCEIDVPSYPINVVRRAITPSESVQAAPLVEELGDLYIGFANDSRGLVCDAMQFLSETLYTLAARSEVEGYCLTPLCPDEIRSIDPYAPQLELWLRGAHGLVRWEDGSDNLRVDIFVKA